jgi:hypothetical protein
MNVFESLTSSPSYLTEILENDANDGTSPSSSTGQIVPVTIRPVEDDEGLNCQVDRLAERKQRSNPIVRGRRERGG